MQLEIQEDTKFQERELEMYNENMEERGAGNEVWGSKRDLERKYV